MHVTVNHKQLGQQIKRSVACLTLSFLLGMNGFFSSLALAEVGQSTKQNIKQNAQAGMLESLQSPLTQESTASQNNLPPLQGGIAIVDNINMTSNDNKVTLSLRNTSIRDVLNVIAKQGDFNVILDESVTGNITVDIKNVSINKALEYLFSVSNLTYIKDGKTLIIATRGAAKEKEITTRTFKAIPVLYKSASMIADRLNTTVFRFSRTGGNEKAVASFDPDSNSLLVMGTESDIHLVEQVLEQMDVPRNRKVYRIRYSTPAQVAQLVAANFFGLGSSSGESGGEGGAAGGGGGGGGAGGGASGGSVSLGSGTQAGQLIEAGGVTLIAEPVSSTLTVMGTPEQIAQVDSIIERTDVRQGQVNIEMALVEIQNQDRSSFIPQLGSMNFGQFTLSLLDTGKNNSFFKYVHAGTVHEVAPIASVNFEAKSSSSSGRILANPNVVAMDGTKSSVNITDEVATISQTVNTNGTQTVTTAEITKEKAGITVDITPVILGDGSVQLQIKPTVTQPIGTVEAQLPGGGVASTFILSERSVNIEAVRIKDSQTLVIAGLVRESNSDSLRKVPGLASMPIVGAMFRASDNTLKNRTELVLMVTPHILKEEAVPYFSNALDPLPKVPFQPNGIQPVSLPKYIDGNRPQRRVSESKEAGSPTARVADSAPPASSTSSSQPMVMEAIHSESGGEKNSQSSQKPILHSSE